MPQKTPSRSPDPIAAAIAAAERSPAVNGSLVETEPLRTWFLGLVDLKAKVGVALRWEELRVQMIIAAKAAVLQRSAVVNGRTRKLKPDEIVALKKFAHRPPSINSMRRYLVANHAERAAKLAAVGGVGRGIRR